MSTPKETYSAKKLVMVNRLTGKEFEIELTEYEHGKIEVNCGLSHVQKSYIFDADTKPNGQKRMQIRLWSGFEKWDDFQAEQYEYETGSN